MAALSKQLAERMGDAFMDFVGEYVPQAVKGDVRGAKLVQLVRSKEGAVRFYEGDRKRAGGVAWTIERVWQSGFNAKSQPAADRLQELLRDKTAPLHIGVPGLHFNVFNVQMFSWDVQIAAEAKVCPIIGGLFADPAFLQWVAKR